MDGIGQERGGEMDGVLSVAMNRRRVLRLVVGAGALAVTSAAFKVSGADAAASAYYRTTSNLNLRNKASLSGKVLLVIPSGQNVKDLGQSSNGFYKVQFDGVSGWAHSDFLTTTTGAGNPSITGTASTTTSVNFRKGPSTADQVIKVLPKYTEVEISQSTYDGFTYVEYQGQSGWIYSDFLAVHDEVPVETLKTTSALNLREEANTSSKVILVMPKGAKVYAGSQYANGFRMVTYNNSTGWAYEEFLA